MPVRHRLYGVMARDAAATARFLGEHLSCDFQARESSYLGLYWHAHTAEAEVRVVSQPDPEGESLENEFAQYPTLIYVDEVAAPRDLAGTAFEEGVIELLRA